MKYLSGKALDCMDAMRAFCYRCTLGIAACAYSCPIGAFWKQKRKKEG